MHSASVSARLSVLFALALVISAPAFAQSKNPGTSSGRALINITAGQIDIREHLSEPWLLGADYRFAPLASIFQLVPSIGAFWVQNGANYVYAALRRDFVVFGNWRLTPGFGAGRFNNRPALELGQSLQFYQGLELSYRFGNNYRMGVSIFHLSNGGLAESNPGTEALVVSFSIPVF